MKPGASRGVPPLRIAIAGGGYVGLVTAAGLATLGHRITVAEAQEDRVHDLRAGRLPIREPGLGALWDRAMERGLAVTAPGEQAYAEAQLIIICVGTPPRDDWTQDLASLEGAARDIGSALAHSHQYSVVAVKSTVLPGTTQGPIRSAVEKASGRRAGGDFGLASVPEFLAEGNAVEDFLNPKRIVVGGLDDASTKMVLAAHEGLPGPRVVTDIPTAEMIKYVSNAFLAARVSLSNEIGNICKALGIDARRVLEAVGMDDRIGPKFLRSGVGFGGSCFAKDVRALAVRADTLALGSQMLRATLQVNEEQPRRLVELLRGRLDSLSGRRIALLGLAFKPGTDDVRESRGLAVARLLVQAGARVVAYDPMAIPNARRVAQDLEYVGTSAAALEGADACVIATEWPEFAHLGREFKAMRRGLVVDGRGALDPRDLNIEYEGLCW